MMECAQCGKEAQYKCATCREPYCSVKCCKLHKNIPCTPPLPPPTEEPMAVDEYEFPTEDMVPPRKLRRMEQSKEGRLKKCLENPHLREILDALDTSPHPDILMSDYMLEPIFTEFVDICLSIVEGKDD